MEWQLIFPADSSIVLNLSRALCFTTFVPARDADASSLLSLRSKHHLVSLSHWDALHTFDRILMLDDNPVEVKEWLALEKPRYIFSGKMWERVFSALTRGGLLTTRPSSEDALHAAIWLAARSPLVPCSGAPHPLRINCRDLDAHRDRPCGGYAFDFGFGPPHARRPPPSASSPSR